MGKEMNVLRPSLLEDERDPVEIRRNLSLVLLCVLISVWIHLVFFIVWQIMDKDAVDNFVFTMESPNPQMEITLTITEDGLEEEAITVPPLADPEASADTAAAQRADSPPAGETAEPEWSEDLLAGLSPEDQALLEALAKAELLPAEENIPVNPDPPMVSEPEAPTHKKYETAVRSAIGRLWIMTPEAINNFRPGRLIVNATIDRDGSLLRFVIIESSGSASLDHLGLEALRGAAPFPPFPDDMAKFSQWDITLIFDYKAKYVSKSDQ